MHIRTCTILSRTWSDKKKLLYEQISLPLEWIFKYSITKGKKDYHKLHRLMKHAKTSITPKRLITPLNKVLD